MSALAVIESPQEPQLALFDYSQYEPDFVRRVKEYQSRIAKFTRIEVSARIAKGKLLADLYLEFAQQFANPKPYFEAWLRMEWNEPVASVWSYIVSYQKFGHLPPDTLNNFTYSAILDLNKKSVTPEMLEEAINTAIAGERVDSERVKEIQGSNRNEQPKLLPYPEICIGYTDTLPRHPATPWYLTGALYKVIVREETRATVEILDGEHRGERIKVVIAQLLHPQTEIVDAVVIDPKQSENLLAETQAKLEMWQGIAIAKGKREEELTKALSNLIGVIDNGWLDSEIGQVKLAEARMVLEDSKKPLP